MMKHKIIDDINARIYNLVDLMVNNGIFNNGDDGAWYYPYAKECVIEYIISLLDTSRKDQLYNEQNKMVELLHDYPTYQLYLQESNRFHVDLLQRVLIEFPLSDNEKNKLLEMKTKRFKVYNGEVTEL